MAYALQVEDLAREHHAQTVAYGIATAMGQATHRPDWSEVVAEFDAGLAEALTAEATEPDRSTRGIRLRVLGVGQ